METFGTGNSSTSTDWFRGQITQTSPGVFKAPEQIINSVQSARAIYNKLRNNHLKRIALYKEIEGMIQGNPPYNPAELAAAGLTSIANFNDMSAMAIYERACLAYWNLLHTSENTCWFTLRIKDKNATDYAATMARHWDFAVKKLWPSFTINVASMQAQLVKFGISPIVFPDERDPRWRVVELFRFFVPDQAQADLDMLTTVCVESELTVQYLWSLYQQFKDKKASDSPWDAKQIGKLLLFVANSPIKDSILPHDTFELERKLYSGDISFDRMYNDTVRIVSLFQTEYDGKVSHYMFHRNFDAGNFAGGNAPGDGFIFQQPNQYKSMQEAFILFTMNPGSYTIHSNRGVGHKMFSLQQAKTQLDCSVVDMAKMASTPIIKSPSLNMKDADQIRFYPGVATNIGTYDFVQNNLGANLQGVISTVQYLNNQLQFNITYSGSDPSQPDPDQGSLSPSQVKLMAFKEFGILKNSINHFYSIFDRLISNMTAKILRSKSGYPMHEIKEVWIQRCVDDGVPEEIFKVGEAEIEEWGMPGHIDVCAARAMGNGSQAAHILGLENLQPIMGSAGAREEREYKKQWITATFGAEHVSAFLNEEDESDEMTGGASLAGVENAVMQAGKSPIFSPDNDHRAHLVIHLALARQIISQIEQQQTDVVEADTIFAVLVPHMQEHIQALSTNIFAKEFYDKTKPLVDQVVKYATLNRKNAVKVLQTRMKQQQEAQAQQQQVLTEEQLKTMQVMNDEKRKDVKLQAQSQRQEEAGANKAQALAKKTQGELAIKAQKAQGEVQVAKMKEMNKNEKVEEAEVNPSGYLSELNGATPAPTDIEDPTAF